MFTASEDGRLKIWDTRSGRSPVLTRNFDNGAPINDAVMHANQGELITCDQKGVVKIWDLTAHACTHQLVSKLIKNSKNRRVSPVSRRKTRVDPTPTRHFLLFFPSCRSHVPLTLSFFFRIRPWPPICSIYHALDSR